MGHGRPNNLAMSPDGRVLLVGDEHGTVSFLDPDTRRELRPPFNAHTFYIRQLVFSPHGSRLLVGGFGVLRLLDARTFRQLASVNVRNAQFINVAFSPDGRELVAMYEDRGKGTLLRFDGRTGARLGAITAGTGWADFAAFTPDGRRLITAMRDPRANNPTADPTGIGGSRIVVRDPQTLRPLRTYPGPVSVGALSPDGRTLATGAADGTVRFTDVRTGEQRTALGRHNSNVNRLQFTRDGRFLASTSDDSSVIVWDVRAGAPGETFEGHVGGALGLALARDGRTMYTGGNDGTLIAWDLVGDRRLGRPFDAGSGSQWWPSTTLSRDGRTLVTARDDGAVTVIDTRTLTSRRLPIAGGPEPGSPSAPAFGPPGTLLVSSSDGYIARVDAHSGRVTGRFAGERMDIFTPLASADGRTMITGGFDGTARLWDVAGLRQLGAPIPFWLSESTYAISPDGSRVAITTKKGIVDVLDTRSRRRLARLSVDGSNLMASGFSRDGRVLVLGSRDGRVRAFSTRDWRPLGPAFAAHAGTVSSVDISPDDRTLLTAGNDAQVRLWDLATSRPIGAPLPGPKKVNAVAMFAPDGKHLFAVFANGRGYRWDSRPSAWKRHACRVAGRRLTRQEWDDALPERDYSPAC